MATDLIFYTNPMSRGRIARWMLEEAGVDYTTEILEYGTTMKAAEYLAINPMGKVPAIRHGDAVVTECAAVCAYIADAFPAAGLAPDVSARSDYYRWFFFGAGPFEAATTNNSLGLDVPVEKQGVVGYGTYEQTLDTLEKAVSGNGYICGDQFTAVDVYLGSQIGFGLKFGSIEARPVFADYWARVSDRDAYRRAEELDNALMPTT